MDKQLATLQEEISLLESKIENIQTITWEPYAVIAAIAGVIVAIYSVISSNRMTGKSFTNFQKTAEADLLFKLNDTIYRSDEGKKIIEGAKKGQKILKDNGGNITERELENFLNELEYVAMMIRQGMLTQNMADQTFGWVILQVHKSSEIMNYIKTVQKRDNDAEYWEGIINYDVKAKIEPNNKLESHDDESKKKYNRGLSIAAGSIVLSIAIAVGLSLISQGSVVHTQLDIFQFTNEFSELDPKIIQSVSDMRVKATNNLYTGAIIMVAGYVVGMFVMTQKIKEKS